MSEPDDSTIYRVTDGLEVTGVPDGYVLYDEGRERVHYLNPTAALVYELCDGSRSVADIRSFMRDAYDLDEAPLLGEFFDSLVSSGLVCQVE